jgi:hypothetical protein
VIGDPLRRGRDRQPADPGLSRAQVRSLA